MWSACGGVDVWKRLLVRDGRVSERVRGQQVLDVGNVDVFALLVGAADLEHERAHVRRHRLPRHQTHHFREPSAQTAQTVRQ